MKKFASILFASLFSLMLCCPSVSATPAESEFVTEISEKLDFSGVTKRMDEIEASLKTEEFSAKDIDSYVDFLTSTESTISENRKELDKQIKFMQKQLDALGEKPKEDETEDVAITEQREELAKELASEDRILKEADLLIIKIEELSVKVLNARSKIVYGSLMNKQSALINPLVFFNSVKLYVIFFWNVVKSPIEWYQNIPAEERDAAMFSLAVMFLILVVALTLAIFLRRFVLRSWGYNKDIELPRFSRKIVAAIAVAIARGLIPASLIGGCILWMISTQIFGESFLGLILMVTAKISLLAIAEATVSRVIFAPNYAQWRLANVSDERAASFTRVLYMFIITNAVATAQVIVGKQAEYSTDTIHFLLVMLCAVKAFFLMWFAKVCFNTYKDSEVSKDETEAEEDSREISGGLKMLVLSIIFLSGAFLVSVFGYPELSSFILNRTIATLVVCGLFEFFRRVLIYVLKRIIVGGPWAKSFKINKRSVGKIEFWLKTTVNPVILLMLSFILLNLWGLPADFILQTFKKLLFGFKIGGIEISLIAMAFGVVVFFASLTIVRIIKNRLANNVLDKIDMDDGIKHSLISGVGFIGFIFSTLLAIIAVGIDLTNLAFIAGALSVGIGFGLQDVIKNLVSGVIILFERPFKVGDWVIINGTEGKIKQINIRSTEMESFNRTSVIVPNATLLSSSVTNLTHNDNISRQSVKVGVAYGSDVEKVRQILLECANKSKLVMKNPGPYVLFQDFGSSSLDFELRFYVNDIWKGWGASSELRFDINRRFIEEGIEIPFQQIVVHSGDKVSENS